MSERSWAWVKIYCDGPRHQRRWLETFSRDSLPGDGTPLGGGWSINTNTGTRARRRGSAARDRAMASVDAATGYWPRLLEGFIAYREAAGWSAPQSIQIDTDGGTTVGLERGAGRVRHSPDGRVSVTMECTRCKARLTVTGDRLAVALDALAAAGVTEISIRALRRGVSG